MFQVDDHRKIDDAYEREPRHGGGVGVVDVGACVDELVAA